MKRHALALLIQPYKNSLMEQSALKAAADTCIERLITLIGQYPNLRFNLVLPGYILEMIDPLKLTMLREQNKRGTIEWLVTGFTEPFISLSPPWLTRENIRAGIETVTHLLDQQPSGYVPPFSNWEPHVVEIYRELGLGYVVLANALFPRECSQRLGCWSTEHLGSSTVLVPLQTLHHYNAPADVGLWLDNLYSQDSGNSAPVKLLGLRYLVPLEPTGTADCFRWLFDAAAAFDRKLIDYQTVKFSEFLSDNSPLGLQYLPSGMQTSNRDDQLLHSFRNWLFSHDQVGIMHRKMLEVCDLVLQQPSARPPQNLLKKLFFVQDINRFRPSGDSGFSQVTDRSWSYQKLIDIEKSIAETNRARGSQARIIDYLRNGSKSIILSNSTLRVCIDHWYGGGIFEMDYAPRGHNLAAAYVRRKTSLPQVIAAGTSRVLFSDHFFAPETTHADFIDGQDNDLGDFRQGRFEYSVKKTTSDVKVVLTRHGALLQGEHNCPLIVEKVFALENKEPCLSFVYQLSNNSMMAYKTTFATELALLLPGALEDRAKVTAGGQVRGNLAWDRFCVDTITEFSLEDSVAGLKLTVSTQKPVSLWCAPVGHSTRTSPDYQGTSLVLSLPVSLEENSSWKFMGRLVLKKTRLVHRGPDAL